MNKKAFTFLFFLSGGCGLVYQILWTRLLSFILGNTYVAISIIVASFLFGLFLGAWLIGRLIHKCQNELKWYAILEFAIGGYALFMLAGYGLFETVFWTLNAITGEANFLHLIGKFILTLLLLLPPTAAMGATLPLVIQYFTRTKTLFVNNISFFYAINTLGGAIGVLAAGFFIIEMIGVREGIFYTAIINLAIGLLVLLNARKEAPQAGKTEPGIERTKSPKKKKKPALSKTSPWDKHLYLAAAGLAGFAALAYEIIWTRGLKFLIHNTTYSFSIILVTFLIGIAVGSIVAPKIKKRKLPVQYIYGVLQIGLGLFAILTIYLFYVFPYDRFFQESIMSIIYDFSYHWIWGIAVFVFICSMMFLIPTVIMGVLFPLINDIYYENVAAKPGKTVSSVYAVNTFFSILGSLAAGFVLVPQFGIKTSLIAISLINIGLGIIFIWKANYKLFPTVAVSLVLLVFVTIFSTGGGEYLYGRGERKQDRVLFYEEGLMATVKVFERQKARYMSIDGVSIASTSRSLMQKEKLIGHLPFFVKPNIRSVLSVGLASGISVGSMALHPSVDKIDCVELIDPVFSAAKSFRDYNYDIFNNPKVNLIKNDIYAFLKYSGKKYDLVSSDGKLGSLYSGNTIMLASDYFELCKESLNDGGVFIHWIPIITPYKALKIITNTLKQSFKHVGLFYFYPSDIFMIASDSPITFDSQYMNTVLENQPVKKDLAPFYIQNGLSILSAFSGFYNIKPEENVRLNTFNQPILEFDYLREWKKSRNIKGGYRAKNMAFLAKNLEEINFNFFASVLQDVDIDIYRQDIFTPSLNFFKSNTRNFQSGNYQLGLRAYMNWKQKLSLNEN